MTRLSQEQKVNALTNFLRNVSKNEELFIFTLNTGKNAKFCIATKTEIGGINNKTSFMTYEEMNAYFFGVLAVKENRVNFNIETPKETEAKNLLSNVAETLENWFETEEERGSIYTEIKEFLNTESDLLTDAINNVTEEIFNSIEHGQEITLNKEYHLYKYSEEDIISIYKTETVEEIIQVLSNGKGSFEFESLI